MSFRIINPGPLSLLQDLGRWGYQSVGVSPGGPMDEQAFLWANRLLDNAYDLTQIEITFGQFCGEFQAATTMALTGADMTATLNDKPIKPWQSYRVNAGDKLSLRGAAKGLRSYLAVKNGLTAVRLLKSSATVCRDGLGGLDGKGSQLKAGDSIGYQSSDPMVIRQVPSRYIPQYSKNIVLALIPGYQYQYFNQQQIDHFFSGIYQVTEKMDRMGCFLKGPSLTHKLSSFISEGIALGAVQVPKEGQPIILMRDRQTIGGYPKLGCLTAKSLNLLAQCLPGTNIRFIKKDRAEAEKELLERKLFFEKRELID